MQEFDVQEFDVQEADVQEADLKAPGVRPAHRVPRWLRGVGEVTSLVALCVSVLAAIVLLVVPFLSGSQTYSVLTSSMAPAYPPGTFVVVRPTDYATLRTGDVVTYQLHSGRPEVVTHRIIAITVDQDGERLVITKGDNNDVADQAPVTEVQVRGKLFYAVPQVGFLANALGRSDRSWVITAVACGLIGWGLVTMIAPVIRRRRSPRNLTPQEAA